MGAGDGCGVGESGPCIVAGETAGLVVTAPVWGAAVTQAAPRPLIVPLIAPQPPAPSVAPGQLVPVSVPPYVHTYTAHPHHRLSLLHK